MASAPVSITYFAEAKKKRERFVVLSLYEAWSARLAEAAGLV